jgi:hypothetical protein
MACSDASTPSLPRSVPRSEAQSGRASTGAAPDLPCVDRAASPLLKSPLTLPAATGMLVAGSSSDPAVTPEARAGAAVMTPLAASALSSHALNVNAFMEDDDEALPQRVFCAANALTPQPHTGRADGSAPPSLMSTGQLLDDETSQDTPDMLRLDTPSPVRCAATVGEARDKQASDALLSAERAATPTEGLLTMPLLTPPARTPIDCGMQLRSAGRLVSPQPARAVGRTPGAREVKALLADSAAAGVAPGQVCTANRPACWRQRSARATVSASSQQLCHASGELCSVVLCGVGHATGDLTTVYIICAGSA